MKIWDIMVSVYGRKYGFDILKVNITEETLLAMILSMLFVWPYGGIREDKKDSSLSEDYGYTEPLPGVFRSGFSENTGDR